MSDADRKETPEVSHRGPIAWMAKNVIAANLAMFVLVVGGLLFASKVTQEVFPAFDLDLVTVRVPYPGASPEEVEQGILRSIESSVKSIDGAKKVTSEALEGVGTVTVELQSGVDKSKALADVKNEVDRIITFPEEAEEPVVSLTSREREVLKVLVHGDVPEGSLRALAETVRDELVAQKEINRVDLGAVRGYEIAVEIPSEELRAMGLTLPRVAEIVSTNALELPAGEVRTSTGKTLVRAQDRLDFGSEFAELPLVTSPEGTTVRIGDVGQVIDGFAEEDIESSFNGEPAIEVIVFRGDEAPITVSEVARRTLAEIERDLPETVGITIWNDQSEVYADRIDLLSRNAFLGLAMVLLLLGLFLEPRIAFWVAVGITVSVVGSFIVFPATGATINLVSLFAFIVTLGIVVDDAIIVGENIYEARARGLPALDAAIQGAREIAAPVVFAVLTNIVAFMPLFFVPGASGKIFLQIPSVVVSVFLISLVESLFILPAHLSHATEDGRIMRALGAPNRWVSRQFDRFSEGVFAPLVTLCLRNRYFVPALGIALLAVSVGFVGSGRIKGSFLPNIDSDTVTATIRLPVGVPMDEARRVARLMEARAIEASDELQPGVMWGTFSTIGANGGQASNLTVAAKLISPDERPEIGGDTYLRAWRKAVGAVAGVESISFSSSNFGNNQKPIDVQLTGADQVVLEAAARDLAERIEPYAGVSDVDNGTASGKRQLSFELSPEGRSLGLTSQAVAGQVRAAFFGAEALRQQRGRNEVKVLVRLPREERERLATVEDLILRTPEGGEVPLAEATTSSAGRSYTSIKRRDGKRIVSVTADVDTKVTDANRILADVRSTILPDIFRRYDGVGASFEGEQESQRESLAALGVGFAFALFAIFAMLAIPLKSYTMPLVVISGAPFGIIGALIGHYVLGYNASLISLFGIIALTGVVVNDSLVLVVTANGYREQGMGAYQAIREAAIRRLRPIMLTSLTTSLGLLPMMLETSTQARFLIPMAISLGFGVLFSTFVILLMVPSLYLVRLDALGVLRVAVKGERRPQPETGTVPGTLPPA